MRWDVELGQSWSPLSKWTMVLHRVCAIHLYFLLLLLLGSSDWRSLALRRDRGSSASIKSNLGAKVDPYHTLAEYLLRSDRKDKDFSKYTIKDIEKVIKKLATSQKTMKQMDGASHVINSAVSDKKSSLTARYRKFEQLDLDQESKSMQKEASKVLEYVNVVERGMQASEILQSLSEVDEKKRRKYLESANLKEIKRIHLKWDKVQVIMSVMRPIQRDASGRVGEGELIIGLVDNCNIENVLRMCTKPTETVALKSVGLLSEEVTVLPVILELSMQALEDLGDLLIPASVVVADDEDSKESTSSSHGIREGMKGKTKLKSRVKVNEDGNSNGSDCLESESTHQIRKVASQTHSRSGEVLPRKVRVLGHSAGGAVAAYIAMILDGSLSIQENGRERVDPVIELYKDRVRCITLASPPCISRNIVPQFVSSLICGDDIISRAHEESLAYMKKRVLNSLKTASGLVGKLPGAAFLSDMAAVAGKSMSSYTGNVHDLESVHVPGRVFFMKNRKHKNGVSFQRVLRGNWREDMVWMLRDIFLSRRMFEHHKIESYIKTLMRC